MNTPLGSPRHRWKDVIKMNLKNIVWEFLECVHMAQDRDQWSHFEYMAMEFWVP